MATTDLTSAKLEELRFRLSGDLHLPGDDAYDEARTLFNAMIDVRPLAVARCAAPDDVVAALHVARDLGVPVAVRAGGHSVTGKSLCEGGLVLDVRGMADVEVDAERRTARVGGGATWAQLDRATQEHGLAVTGGRVSSTGVAGLTLGGGSGWLERKHGLSCDNLVAAEVVTADGRIVRTSPGEHPELLWALRGGLGGVGVVTALEFRLHPVGPEVFGGLMIHPTEHAGALLRAWRDTMRDASEGLSLAFAWLTIPEDDELPAELHGRPAVVIAGMYAGPVAEGEAALAPLRAVAEPAADLFGALPYAEMQCAIDDPPGHRNWWTAENVRDLPDEAVDRLVARCRQFPAAGASQLFLVAWGGAVARHDPAASPLTGRDAAFVVHPLMMWDDPALDEEHIAVGRAIREDVLPWSTGGSYPNFISEVDDARAVQAFGVENLARLRAIQDGWDPGRRFH